MYIIRPNVCNSTNDVIFSQKLYLQKVCSLCAPLNLSANLFYLGIQCTLSLRKRGFVTVNFYTAAGEKKTVKGEPGETVMRIAQHNGIPLEGFTLSVFVSRRSL